MADGAGTNPDFGACRRARDLLDELQPSEGRPRLPANPGTTNVPQPMRYFMQGM